MGPHSIIRAVQRQPFRTRALVSCCRYDLARRSLVDRLSSAAAGGGGVDGRKCSRSSRRFSSTSWPSSAPTSAAQVFPFSSSSLGLDPSFVSGHLDSIKQLPEVDTFLSEVGRCGETKAGLEDGLKRASEIFEQFAAGGKEHMAVLSLLAEYHHRCGRYDGAVRVLEVMEQLLEQQGEKERTEQENASPSLPMRLRADVHLAKSKVLWMDGQFQTSKDICDAILEDHSIEDILPFHHASARTGQAVARLAMAESLDDAFTLKDPPRMVIRFVERCYGREFSPSLPLAAAHLNYGVAEVVYADVVGNANDVDVPLDGAMRSWKQGLTALKKQRKKKRAKDAASGSNASIIAATLQARLKAHMGWGILHMTRELDNVNKASEFTKEALDVYDNKWPSSPEHAAEGGGKEGLAQTLSVAAACYHQSDQAVTAEGLFQSATSQSVPVESTLSKLERRDVWEKYADLCRDWDRRERDAENARQKASDIDGSLPEGWRGKPAILSSLWFWTPGLFV